MNFAHGPAPGLDARLWLLYGHAASCIPFSLRCGLPPASREEGSPQRQPFAPPLAMFEALIRHESPVHEHGTLQWVHCVLPVPAGRSSPRAASRDLIAERQLSLQRRQWLAECHRTEAVCRTASRRFADADGNKPRLLAGLLWAYLFSQPGNASTSSRQNGVSRTL